MLCDNSDDLKIMFSLVFFNLNIAKLKNLRLLLNIIDAKAYVRRDLYVF